jgi:cation transport regulator
MPYDSTGDLPGSVKKLPGHAQRIFRAAFNNALKQYGEESKAFATAWAAVEKAGYKPAGEATKKSLSLSEYLRQERWQ